MDKKLKQNMSEALLVSKYIEPCYTQDFSEPSPQKQDISHIIDAFLDLVNQVSAKIDEYTPVFKDVRGIVLILHKLILDNDKKTLADFDLAEWKKMLNSANHYIAGFTKIIESPIPPDLKEKSSDSLKMNIEIRDKISEMVEFYTELIGEELKQTSEDRRNFLNSLDSSGLTKWA